jgi:hypothetical protein
MDDNLQDKIFIILHMYYFMFCYKCVGKSIFGISSMI